MADQNLCSFFFFKENPYFNATGTELFRLPMGNGTQMNDKGRLLVTEDLSLYLSLNKHKRIIYFTTSMDFLKV